MPAASGKNSRSMQHTKSPARSLGTAQRGETSEAEVYKQIHAAIAEQRLLPGVRLVEDQLAELFGVNRMRIRSVLRTLAHDKVVTLHRNRGAVVAYPTVREAQEVFAARRLIEVALAPEIVRAADEEAITRLRAHVREERRCEMSNDRARELQASHGFHTLLAEIVGNQVIIAFLRELMARSSLITAAYERPDVSTCSHKAHGQLITFIAKRDPAGLAAAMLQHLQEIESDLILVERPEVVTDLRSIFSAR
jgi:DNA-binding GntR family transcriptional regulator